MTEPTRQPRSTTRFKNHLHEGIIARRIYMKVQRWKTGEWEKNPMKTNYLTTFIHGNHLHGNFFAWKTFTWWSVPLTWPSEGGHTYLIFLWLQVLLLLLQRTVCEILLERTVCKIHPSCKVCMRAGWWRPRNVQRGFPANLLFYSIWLIT